MSGGSPTTPDLRIVSSILDAAREQARKISASAMAQAEAARHEVEVEAQKLEKQLLSEAENEAQRHRTRERAMAEVEAHRKVLAAREGRIVAALARIANELKRLPSDTDRYRRSLVALAAEAVRGLDADHARLELREEDGPIVEAGFIEAVQAEIGDSGKNPVEIELQFVPDAACGCTAVSADGRVRFENTYTRRLADMERDLRKQILRRIEQHHE
ncbi:MAG: hypothetical protein IT368_16530 [Candidatus Hydrogenedentes bacterium]|nr:hypothetical protein [Candidatus Hydrogenedentota bacterium]